jgi:hypothetical protein
LCLACRRHDFCIDGFESRLLLRSSSKNGG